MHGAAERALDGAGRRLAPAASALIAIVAGVLALTVIPAERRPLAAGVVGLLALWRAGYAAGIWHGVAVHARAGRLLLGADVVLTSAIALGQRWLDAPYLVADSAGWVQTLVVVTAVSYPWVFRWRTGLAAAGVVAASFGAGAVITIGPRFSAVILPAIWVFGNAAMSAFTAEFMRVGARRADDAAARRERAQADLDVAQARRAAEREHLAALHDTAAATLLMVGLGTVRRDDAWLAQQAERDLAVLAEPVPGAGREDLIPMLRTVIAGSGVHAPLHCAEGRLVLPATVAAAFANAAGEALANVRRHSGGLSADVRLERDGDVVRLEVADAGRGLPVAPDGSPIAFTADGARGRGVQHSIVERMRRVQGSGEVRPGTAGGARVILEWPR